MKKPAAQSPDQAGLSGAVDIRAELAAFGQGYKLSRPASWRAGVVFASPHSGHIYPRSLINRSNLSIAHLRRNEDMFIDKLFGPVTTQGAPLLCALFPRCYVDVNRAPDEMPRKWLGLRHKITPRAAAGLGVVPTHMSETTQIYRRPLSREEGLERIARLYRPYHATLADILGEAASTFGHALLLDCHSMPGFAPMGARRPDIILGDRFGTSCHAETIQMVKLLFQQAGFSVATNYPYAGGYVTEHYGRPHSGIEALQIEVNRDLYLNPVTLSPKRGYERLARNLSEITTQIISSRAPQALAAQ